MKVSVGLLVFVAGLTSQICATQCIKYEEKLECLRQFEIEYKELEVPKGVVELAANLYSINKFLGSSEELSLTQVLQNERAEKNILDKGFFTEEQKDNLVSECVSFLNKITSIEDKSACSNQLELILNPVNEDYKHIVGYHSPADEAMGYKQACLTI